MFMKIYKFLILLLFVIILGCSSNKEKPLEQFHVTSIDGEIIDNEYIKDKTVVFNVWGTWCAPCVGEINELNNLVEKYKEDDSVLFIALADEDKTKISTFLKRKEFNYLQISNAKALTSKLHTGLVKTIPLHVIVNSKGIITFEMTGASKEIVDILSSEIEKSKE